MKATQLCCNVPSDTSKGDSSKLISLLAMATGALAMPQAANGDIIFTDLGSSPISVLGANNASFLIDTLPGTARLGFCGHTIVSPPMMLTTHSVRGSQKAGYVRFKTDAAGFMAMAPAGLSWNQVVGVSSVNGYAAIANQKTHSPNSFDHLYVSFKFKDINLPPQANVRYGWIDLSLENANDAIPKVTIFGYAYGDAEVPILTGATVVPEPAPVALLAIGALTLGAKGLRAWRRNRAAID